MPRYSVIVSDSSRQRMRRFLATLARGRTRELRWSGEAGSRALAIEEAHNAWVEHFHELVPAKPVVECTQLPDSGVTRGGPGWLGTDDYADVGGRRRRRAPGGTLQRHGSERRVAENVAIERLRFGGERASAFAVEIFPGEEGYLPPPEDTAYLSELQEELLKLCAIAPHMGETTTTLHEEMLSEAHDRRVIEASLCSLVARGLMTTSRGTFGGVQRSRDGREEHRVYEDDWWVVTDEGRAAVGLPPKKNWEE
jgi:hypothetical protein